MAGYNFKSVGRTQKTREAEKLNVTTTPIGIKSPLEISTTGDLLVMHTSLLSTAANNLSDLIKTNWGDRLGRYNFGANLRPLLSEFTNQESFDQEAVERIKSAVDTWMPYVELGEYNSRFDRINNRRVAIAVLEITFDFPAINARNNKINVTLAVM